MIPVWVNALVMSKFSQSVGSAPMKVCDSGALARSGWHWQWQSELPWQKMQASENLTVTVDLTSDKCGTQESVEVWMKCKCCHDKNLGELKSN